MPSVGAEHGACGDEILSVAHSWTTVAEEVSSGCADPETLIAPARGVPSRVTRSGTPERVKSEAVDTEHSLEKDIDDDSMLVRWSRSTGLHCFRTGTLDRPLSTPLSQTNAKMKTLDAAFKPRRDMRHTLGAPRQRHICRSCTACHVLPL